MTTMHVTEMDIQKYVLQKNDCDPNLIEHMQLCEACQLKATHYQLLFEGINQQEAPAFDFNLAECVMPQLVQPTPKRSPAILVVWLLVMIGCSCFATLFYLFDVSNLFTSYAASVNGLIIVSVLAILLFQNVEFYKKYKSQMYALDLK